MVLSAALSSLGFVRFLESGSRGSYEFCTQPLVNGVMNLQLFLRIEDYNHSRSGEG